MVAVKAHRTIQPNGSPQVPGVTVVLRQWSPNGTQPAAVPSTVFVGTTTAK